MAGLGGGLGIRKMDSVYTILSLLQKAISFMEPPDVLHREGVEVIEAFWTV